MRAHARAHPQYGWQTNVGYSTPEHLAALRCHGPCPLHRRSFAPVAQADLFEGESPAGESFAPHHEMLSPPPEVALNIV
jgi:ribonuclease HII